MKIHVTLLCAIPLFAVFGSVTASAALILSFVPSSPSSLFTGSTGSNVGTVNFAGEVFTGYDATDDANDPDHLTPLPVTLTTTDLLLFRLNLDAAVAGNYQISITSATFLENYFDSPDDGISFTTANGMITVADATTAVPEPSTAVIPGLTFVCGLCCRRSKCWPTDGLRKT